MDVLDECIVEIMECSLQNSRERDYKGSGEQQRYPYQLSLKVSIPHSVCTKEKMRQSPVDKAIGWDFPSSLCTCFSKCMHIKCCLVEVRVYGLIWQGGAQPTCLRLVSYESLATDISLFQKVQCSPQSSQLWGFILWLCRPTTHVSGQQLPRHPYSIILSQA